MSVAAKPSARGSGRVGQVADGARITPASRKRSMPVIAVGLLCCFAGALIFGVLYLGNNKLNSVLTIRRAVPAGAVIEDSDLLVARISSDEAIRPISSTERSSVVGKKATVGLAPGSLLTRGQIGGGTQIPAGSAVIGLALKAGQLPANLSVGDSVMLVEAPLPASAGGTSVQAATIQSASVFEVSSSPDPIGATLISVLVPMTDAAEAAASASAGRMSIVLVGSTP